MWVSRRVRRQSFMRHFQIDDQRDDRKVERSTGEQNWMDDSGNFSPPMTSPFLSTCNVCIIVIYDLTFFFVF